MKIKKSHDEYYLKKFSKLLFNRRNIRLAVYFIFIPFIIIIGMILGSAYTEFFGAPSFIKEFIASDWFIVHGIDAKEIAFGVIHKNVLLPYHYLRGQFSNPEKLIIDIKFKDYQTLAYQRALALQYKYLINDSYVPATMGWEGKKYNIRMKLKGLVADHWVRDKKWSFRIRLKGDEAIMGMKAFSLQHPKTRDYINEWYMQKMYDDEGLTTPRYKFVEVLINGDNFGIYALEEHPEKRLIENNKKKEGPIFKFELDFDDGHYQTGNIFFTPPLKIYDQEKIMADNELQQELKTVNNLMAVLGHSELLVSEIFDIEHLAFLFAATDLIGQGHAVSIHNLLFYYNPITSRIEPIPRDTQMMEPLKTLYGYSRKIKTDETVITNPKSWADLIFQDELFFREYIQTLERISKKSYLDIFFKRHQEEAKREMDILYKSFPFYSFIWKPTLYENQEKIQRMLNPKNGISAYFEGVDTKKNIIKLRSANFLYLPIEIESLTAANNTFWVKEKTLLQAYIHNESPDYREINFVLPQGINKQGFTNKTLRINYKILGSSSLRTHDVHPLPYFDKKIPLRNSPKADSNIESFEFLVIDDNTNTILIREGNWIVESSIIIPKGYHVENEGSLVLDLKNGANIISYSPFYLKGSKKKTILIKSSDSTGQGLFIFETDEPNHFNNVKFENLDAPHEKGWVLSGAVTFYESNANIESCIFSGARSEDMLNIVRSKFNITDVTFSDSFSDSFDADFTEGTLQNVRFQKCGNDCLDFSGSIANANEIVLSKAGDKALSVGEKSTLTISNLLITDSNIGIASKDLTTINADHVTISNTNIGLAAYEKKTEFGSASMHITDLIIDNVTESHMIEEGSILVIDGEIIKGTLKNLKEILY